MKQIKQSGVCFLLTLILILCAAACVSCSNGETSDPGMLTISDKTLRVGETSDAAPVFSKNSYAVTYSFDGNVISIDGGKITANEPGTVVVTAKTEYHNVTFTVTVTEKTENYGKLYISDIVRIFVGEQIDLSPVFSDFRYIDEIRYSFDGDAIKIENDVVTALKADVSVTVTATTKYHKTVFTVATASESEPDPEWKKDGVLRILTIGNSFSDDTMEYVYQIAKSAGVTEIELGNLYIGGCTLATHANNAKGDLPAYEYRVNTRGTWLTTRNYKMSAALSSEKWDFISMQQSSGSSGLPETYGDLDYLIGYVRENANPEAVLVWNMTWAYQQNSNHADFPKYGRDQINMYRCILNAVSEKVKTKKEISIVSPAGTAIQNARTSYVGDNLTRDGYHLSYDLGRYIAGLTFFKALTGLSIDKIDFAPENVDENMMMVAKEAANNAVAEPWQITNSKYTEVPFHA